MYTLNGRQVEITETEHDDGMIMVIAANFSSDMGVDELTPDQLQAVEEKYQDELLIEYTSSQIDHAMDMMEDF